MKFDSITQDKLIARLRAGDTRQEAAAAARISRRTLQEWIAKGRASLDGGGELDEWGLFALEVEAATADFVGEMRACVAAAARRGEWRAAAFILDRMPQPKGEVDDKGALTAEKIAAIEAAFLGVPQ